VPASITHFVSLEVRSIDTLFRRRFLAPFRHRAFIAVFRMETVIYVTSELARAMEPWAGPNEDTVIKPFGTIVAGRSTSIRSGVIVTIGTDRSYADVDADLSLCSGCSREADSNNGSYQR